MADDKLQIDITADNSKAIQSLNSLCNALDKLNTKLGRNVNTNAYKNSINGLKSTIDGLNQSAMTFNGQAVQNLNTNLVSLAKTLGKFGNKKPMQASQSITAMSVGIKDLVASMNGLNVQGQAKGFTDLASSISKLGGKNAQQAVTTIPQLTKELRDFFAVMSQAPQVSDNTLRMTNALANLASQGGKVRSATSGLRSYLDYINRGANNSRGGFNNLFNTITSGSKRASSGMKSLSYYFGKFYASYFLIIRALSGFKKAVGYASDLTEVQNVVDHVFGSATEKVEEFSKATIDNFGMSILTTKKVASEFQAIASTMGITSEQVKASNSTWSSVSKELEKAGQAYNNTADSVADMSINLTKLASDMGSFYNQEYDQVAERLASGIMTGQTRVLRQYGLDLTQATLKEWALTQGIEANFKTMTQAEKTMLRYQYVMAHTENIQGDFIRTSSRQLIAA